MNFFKIQKIDNVEDFYKEVSNIDSGTSKKEMYISIDDDDFDKDMFEKLIKKITFARSGDTLFVRVILINGFEIFETYECTNEVEETLKEKCKKEIRKKIKEMMLEFLNNFGSD